MKKNCLEKDREIDEFPNQQRTCVQIRSDTEKKTKFVYFKFFPLLSVFR